MLTLLSLALAPSALAAEDKPLDIKFDGVLFAQYGYDLTDTGAEATDGFNAFDLTRAYAGFRVDKGPHLAVRLLLDAGRNVDNTKQWVFVKNAYVEWKDPAPGLKLQAGMVGSPWTVFYDNFWGARYVSKSFADQFKVLQTADFGVSAQGNHAKGLVDWTAVAVNGEGYASPEIDQTKTFQGRLTIDPMAKGEKNNLPISGIVSYSTAPYKGDATLVYGGAVGFRHDYVLVWGEYIGQSTGDLSAGGYSAVVMPKIPDVLNVIVRYDHWDPDADTDKDGTNRIVGGLSHDFVKRTSLALTYERTTLEALPDDPIHGVFVKGQAGF